MLIHKTKDCENDPILQKDDSLIRLPIRYIIVFMCCVVNSIIYGMRMNFNIAITSMARPQVLDLDEEAEVFNWDMETQQVILGAFYFGYTFTPLIGGWLVGKFGGFRIVLLGALLSSLMMLSTPISARINVSILTLTRILDGMGQGVVFPGIINIITKWSTLNERSTFLSIALSGSNLGPILSSYVSAWICSSLGWPSTFYIFGICGITWSVGWCIVGSDEADNNRWNRKYIPRSEQMQTERQVYTVPWKQIVTSAPVLALCVCSSCFDFGYYLLSADIPTFYNNILGFEIKTSGLLTVISQVLMFITIIFGGIFGDTMISRSLLSVTTTRKLFACFALGVPSVLLVSIRYTDNATLIVVLVTSAFGMYGFFIPGIDANAMDIAPNHSALIIGIMFSISSLTGFIGPVILGAFTSIKDTIYQWDEMFVIVAGVHAVGLLVFLKFSRCDVQEWSKTDYSKTEKPSLETLSAKTKTVAK